MKKGSSKSKAVAGAKDVPRTAPGQALGYGLQYTRLTAMLMTAAEGSYCSLEVLDDVAEHHQGGNVHLVQSKSALGANPVSDRATSLWKTFANWLRSAKAGHIDPEKTVFEIYVSRLVDGKIIDAFSHADSLAAAQTALDVARLELWGKPPRHTLKPDLAADIAAYVDEVLGANGSPILNLIKNFRLVCGSGSPHEDLEAQIRAHPVSPSKVVDIADHMCGVVKRDVDKLLEKSLPAVIGRDQFHTQYSAYCRRVDRDTILKSSAEPPTSEERLARLPDVFVQQLDLISLSFEDKLAAVSDYLMACADRTDWAKTGDVDSTSFDELDDVLSRFWKNSNRSCGIEHKDKAEIDRGNLLYSDCMAYQTKLQAMQTPAHFIPGCFHRLADIPTLGWHPTYEQLLRDAVKTKKAA